MMSQKRIRMGSGYSKYDISKENKGAFEYEVAFEYENIYDVFWEYSYSSLRMWMSSGYSKYEISKENKGAFE